MRPLTKWALGVGALAVVVLAAAAVLAPYVYAELSPLLQPHAIVDPARPQLAAGAMVDDYWAVQPLGADTYAIGEPRYYQQNYAYLIIGQRRALLFDAGSGTRDIAPIVARLTTLPVTLVVSHLHFDHLGGVGPFASVAMIDLPQTRADVTGGRLTPSRYQYLGLVDRRAAPTVAVAEWLKPDTTIDLGGRVLRVLSTPGHTPTSVSLYDPAAHRLFAGDYIYPTTLYAFLPGASLSTYQATARRLLTELPADTILWTAHCCRVGEKISAPWLAMSDLRDLDGALAAHAAGRLKGSGVYPRRFPVNRQMTLGAGFPWTDR